MTLCTGGFIMNEYSSTFTDISHVELLKNTRQKDRHVVHIWQSILLCKDSV